MLKAAKSTFTGILSPHRLPPYHMASSTLSIPSISRTIPPVYTTTHIRCRPRDNVLSCHTRSFTTSKPTLALAGQSRMPKNIMKSLPPQQGMRSRMKNLSRQEIPNDVGILPQTLIRPPPQDLPKFLGADWKRRLKFEWLWTKTRFQNFFTYVPPPDSSSFAANFLLGPDSSTFFAGVDQNPLTPKRR
jgi:hypothetical protein